MKKIAFLVIMLLSVTACAAGIRYTVAEIKGFSPEVQEHIRGAEITMGMSRAAVRYSWGAPSEVNALEPDSKGKDREEWVYKRLFSKITVHFSGGEVSQIITGDSTAKGREPKQR